MVVSLFTIFSMNSGTDQGTVIVYIHPCFQVRRLHFKLRNNKKKQIQEQIISIVQRL